MRNLFKARIVPLFGIMALVAVIGFSMAACGSDDDGTNDGSYGDYTAAQVAELRVEVVAFYADGTAADWAEIIDALNKASGKSFPKTNPANWSSKQIVEFYAAMDEFFGDDVE